MAFIWASHEATPVSHACAVASGIPTNPQINERVDMLISSLRNFWDLDLESLGIIPSLLELHVYSLPDVLCMLHVTCMWTHQ